MEEESRRAFLRLSSGRLIDPTSMGTPLRPRPFRIAMDRFRYFLTGNFVCSSGF